MEGSRARAGCKRSHCRNVNEVDVLAENERGSFVLESIKINERKTSITERFERLKARKKK